MLFASFGGALEYYDFIVYGIFAAEIARTIFPGRSPLVSLMSSFGAFAVGYIARPVGGVVLSHFGDRFGRRRIFVVSLLGMSIATIGMGLVPSYAAWGLLAPVLMVLLRLLQGFCLGGELPGAITYVTEVAGQRASFANGLVFVCVMGGVFLASLLSLSIHTLMPLDLIGSYGWRIPFWIGGALGGLGYWLRTSLEESPEFERIRRQASLSPFLEVLRSQPQKILIGIGLVASTGAFNGLLFAHMPAYLTTVLGVAPGRAALEQNAALVAHGFALLATAWVGMHIPPRRLMLVGTLLLALLAVLWYSTIANGRDPGMTLALGGVVAGLFNGTFAYLIADLFPTKVRFTGIAVVLNIGMTVFSGLAPVVATSLIHATHRLDSPGWFLACAGLLGLVASLFVNRYDGQILYAENKSQLGQTI